MDWERASPSSEAVAGDKKSKLSPTDLSNNNRTTGQLLSRKNKPIPPPLDLSIGHHQSLHHQNNNNNLNSPNQIQSQPWYVTHPTIPSPYLGSPKFTQSDKSLPLRKRWHSWSPILMNGQEESLLPLYSDHLPSQLSAKHQQSGMTLTEGENTPQSPLVHHNQSLYPYTGSNTNYRLQYGSINGSLATTTSTTTTTTATTNNHNHNGISTMGLLGIQTPSPFYTPNEPSPKFFSYSTPDTTLYQGPFSPMRSSSLYPPSSPFTNLSLNTPGGPMSSSPAVPNSCFNMIPSTLLSPAPSQASTNSLSYEDLHEKSLNFFNPVWNIFMSGTKIRFCQQMNSMDWCMVDFLAQSNDPVLNVIKGEYAPHGLEVRTLVVTSSSKERIQITFFPVGGDPDHPSIEVDCEPGHPFMVDKKGWCSVKPDVFLETYGTHCLNLEGGDVCLNLSSSSRCQPNSSIQLNHYNGPQATQHLPMVPYTTNATVINNVNLMTHHGNGSSNQLSTIVKMEPGISLEEKTIPTIPISVLPQTQTFQSSSLLHQQQQQQQQHQQQQQLNHSNLTVANNNSGKKFALPMSGTGALPVKRSKDSVSQQQQTEQKGRRPMNAFLLFAKDKRPELIQQYPGKDNRSISVLLGEAWANLEPQEKEKYASNARARAEEQKRKHPDCWKRKRSQSTSS